MTRPWNEILAAALEQNMHHFTVLCAAMDAPDATAPELGAKLGITAESVRWIFWKYGVKRGRVRVQARVKETRDRRMARARVTKLRKQGAAITTISEETGIGFNKTRRLLAEAGMPSAAHSAFTPERRAKLLFLREEKKLSYEKIAKKMGGVATSTVATELARARAEARR